MPSITRFDEQIVVHQIDEILADRRNGILKNFKTPIELRVEPETCTTPRWAWLAFKVATTPARAASIR